MKHIILFGFKSCGKTYLGKKLAQQLGHSFLDTDLILEELYAQKYGKLLKCPQIYRQEGSKVFS